jgi:Flp pilus assembly protein TadG
MFRSRLGDRGTVTAEFAAAFPAVFLTLGLLLSALQVFALQIEMQRVAGSAARLLARGESLDSLGALRSGLTISSIDQQQLVCAEVSHDLLQLKESACALKFN